MSQCGYSEDEDHKQGHQRLLGEVNYLRGKFVQGGELLVLQLLKDWLLSHIATDKPLADCLIRHGVDKLQ